MLLARWGFMLAFVVSLLLVAGTRVIAMRHAPFEESEIQAFFAPSGGCKGPCFLELRVGAVVPAQLTNRLRKHEWVASVDVRRRLSGTYRIFWSWSGKQPDFINTQAQSTAEIEGSPTDAVIIPMKLRYADVLLLFGEPSSEFVIVFNYHSKARILMVYAPQGMMFTFDMDCPIEHDALLRQRASAMFAPLPRLEGEVVRYQC
jgi:hypothetical protein